MNEPKEQFIAYCSISVDVSRFAESGDKVEDVLETLKSHYGENIGHFLDECTSDIRQQRVDLIKLLSSEGWSSHDGKIVWVNEV